jgi:hypothetical protein
MSNMFFRAYAFNQVRPTPPAARAPPPAPPAAARAPPPARAPAPAPAPVRIALTIQDYMSLCLTANKTDEACRKATCPICLTNFIVKGHLIRPVMFHKGMDSKGNEIWTCPMHPEEQLKTGNTCAGCRTPLFIPESLKTDIRKHGTEELVEKSEATSGALRLQSVFRGHRSRRSNKPQDGGKKNKKHFRKVKTLRKVRKTRRNRRNRK